tara:strand:- start:2231 stop:2425 length:195 start_codon:yes stop_codon:yes gene_type:complete
VFTIANRAPTNHVLASGALCNLDQGNLDQGNRDQGNRSQCNAQDANADQIHRSKIGGQTNVAGF